MATMDATLGHAGTAHLSRWDKRRGVLGWLTTVDHKRIAIMYLVTTFFFFIVGGVMALLLRTQLAEPGNTFLSPGTYNEIMTMHGTTMIFLWIIPVLAGFGNYFVPLMIGARDMAFPRINALSFWLIPLGGLVLYSGFLFGGTAEAGWTGYVPLTELKCSSVVLSDCSGVGQDLWILGLHLLGISSMLGGINFLVTIHNMRAPGMTLFRMPLFVWSMEVTSALVVLASPFLAGALAMVLMDRQLGTDFFGAMQGAGGHPANPLLYQLTFWFYSHPAVYIMILPAFGIISEVIPVFARKPIFGYRVMAYSMAAIAVLGFIVFVHHMFQTGLPQPVILFFSATSMIIGVPTGVKIFNWTATMWGGSIRYDTPMLFAVGFLLMFLIGGVDGVYVGSIAVDEALHGTYWVVSHIHYVLFGGSVMGVFAGIYYWFPKVTGRFLDERLGKLHFWLMLLGLNLTFMPMHIVGMLGMPRRISSYADDRGWGDWNSLETMGAFVIAASICVFLINFVLSLRAPRNAPPDPWEGNTLEWATTSPPPPHNFDVIPEVRSTRPVRDMRRARRAATATPTA